MSNFFDNVGKFISESCSGYYGSGVQASSTGGVSSGILRALKGFTAVDTPISDFSSSGLGNSVRGQISRQAEFTLQQRNYLLSQIDKISGHWIAYAIKAIIASDGFNDLVGGLTHDVHVSYTDEKDPKKQQEFTESIHKLFKRTGFREILKDCVINEGLDYCELFLSTPTRRGYGVEYVADNIDIREHIGIYKNTNFLGAIKFEITPRGSIRGREFIKGDQISHFLLGYKKIPLVISKNFNKKYNIPEKIRCAYPILTPVIDLIIQYDQLSKLQAALEMIKATQPIVMGVGVSSDNNITDTVKQLQEWGLTLNENKNNIIGSLDTSDTSTILQSMYNILMVPYSVDEGINALKQVAVNFPDSNLPEVLNNLLQSIALAVGIPEQDITLLKGGAKETKEDTITTNPRYSKMLSMIQQSLAKGIVDFIYKHLKARYTNADGLLTRTIERDKIEVIFKSSTNLNDRFEDERLMMKAENMNSMLNVIDTIAASSNIHVKVNSNEFLEYWTSQMAKDTHLRRVFVPMTEEEIQAEQQLKMQGNGAGLQPQSGDGVPQAEGEGGEQQEEQQPNQEEVTKQVQKQQESPDTKEETEIKQIFK